MILFDTGRVNNCLVKFLFSEPIHFLTGLFYLLEWAAVDELKILPQIEIDFWVCPVCQLLHLGV